MFKKQTTLKTGGQILLIPQEELLPNPHRARDRFDDESLELLAESVRENGILQPLHVRPHAGGYQVVLGERRLRAARMAGLLRIPCIVMELCDRQAALFTMIENRMRQPVSFFEEAQAIDTLINRFQYSYESLAKNLGMQKQELMNKQRLLRLPEDLRETIAASGLSEQHAFLLLRLPSNDLREKALNEINKKKLSPKQTETLIRDTIRKLNSESSLKILYKDIRIFTNTIDHAIETMKECEIAAETVKKESKDFIEYTIKIPIEREDAKKKCPSVDIQLVK
ncbi:MAG: ParB/RepB/Spo0J family partition protein [Oscillospiraceae bacterium]|nr:ParB/RepB/Spo0J family partition protein [Oscillospiraceae bacterium]